MRKQREELIGSLVSYHKGRGHAVTIVFDGWKDGRGHETKTVTGGITVIYSGLGERADNVIKKIIADQRRTWVVVSSDREIQSSAWKHECVPIDADVFYDRLMRSLDATGENGSTDGIWEEDEYMESPKKGSPRKLSWKEKSIRRVIDKL
jgi:predicted RNA-binding protein with PIN domain